MILDVGSLTGTGEIRANGGDGQTAANDGGGGGGAGGRVVVAAASGGLSGLTVSANGGDGGDAWPTQAPGGFPGARHGPGGGGGGGFVLLSTSGATTTTDGGAHGITTTANDAYGATDGSGGSAGTFAGSLPGSGSAASCSPQYGDEADVDALRHEHASGTTATYTIAVANAPGRDTARQVALTDVLPTGFTYASTGAVTLDGGATRAVAMDPTAGVAVPSWSEFTIPGGASVSVTFTVAVASSVSATTLQNPALADVSRSGSHNGERHGHGILRPFLEHRRGRPDHLARPDDRKEPQRQLRAWRVAHVFPHGDEQRRRDLEWIGDADGRPAGRIDADSCPRNGVDMRDRRPDRDVLALRRTPRGAHLPGRHGHRRGRAVCPGIRHEHGDDRRRQRAGHRQQQRLGSYGDRRYSPTCRSRRSRRRPRTPLGLRSRTRSSSPTTGPQTSRERSSRTPCPPASRLQPGRVSSP